jgi:hypothetical protein
MPYRHVQKAPHMYALVVAGALFVVMGALADDGSPNGSWWFLAVWLLVIAVGLLMARLTVVVDHESVAAAFGWGWPRRRIELATVVDATPVRNRWWAGWGIRKVSRGWMFNNSGREAVELTLVSSRVFRIGTDQPAELLAAIERAQTP